MNELQLMDKEILSSLILNGDISKLNPSQRVEYVTKLCERVGVDPLTQPFKILELQGKEVLYADKGCTQQLCKVYGISTEVTKKEKIEDVYVVTVRAIDKNGRFTDEDGAVCISEPETIKLKEGTWPNGKPKYVNKPNPNVGKILKGDNLCNALMKAVTKAKRRSVLAFCGLGMLDETEIETIPNAQIIDSEIGSTVPKKAFSGDQGATNDNELGIGTDEDKLTEEQGNSILKMLINAGLTKQDLKEFCFFTFELEKITDIKNKHLPAIKQFIANAKNSEAK